MKLYFIRHGKAGFNAASDEARPLTATGIEQAKNNGAVLKAMGIRPAKIYSSPRLRARQTAEYIGEALGLAPEIHEACNFDFSKEKALHLASLQAEDDEILFVGHNPSMSEVVTAISGAYVELPTCAIACVTRFNPDYPSATILKWLLTPKVVSAMLKSHNF